jgi:23S rRNA (uracil1939-C5)-methyltransferase
MHRSAQARGEMPARSVVIDSLGGRGDGLAVVDGERWFVAGALAGERVLAVPALHNRDGVHAELERVEQPSSERVEPPCPHFADARAPCGGCSLQHLATPAYTQFKRNLIAHALEHRGLAELVDRIAAPKCSPERSRRRVTLSAVGARDGAVVGFHQRRSKRVVDLTDCVIAVPAITELLPALRRVLADFLRSGERAGVSVAAVDSGLIIELSGPVRHPGRRLRERLEALAEEHGACRLTWRPTAKKSFSLIADRHPATHHFAGVPVDLPYGAFLQATAEGEAAIRDVLMDTLGTAAPARVADLYAGCGSLALPLAASGHRVRAVDIERNPLRALGAAAARAALDVTTERRDLDARPPTARELAAYDAVVFDPPRAGARMLAAELAESDVPTVVAVSCHPGTFARDARALIDGGYHLERIQPVDQFLYSSHVELVGVFRRDPAA